MIKEPPPSLIGDVAYSLPSQSFRGSLEVTLATTIEAAEIRYTTDRSLPSAASALYDGALAVTQTTALRARAFVGGQPAGAVSTALYVARDFDVSSNIPILIVDGFGLGAPRDKDVYVDAAVMVFEPAQGEATLAALPHIAARAGYHERGSSSASFPQRSYRVELRDNADDDADYPLLGMPADSDWALVAPYMDRALIRNPFVYGLGRDMGLQAPNLRYAEVYVNTEDGLLQESDYAGVYFVTETIKNAKQRTDLSQLEPEDTELPAITGGYIVKFEGWQYEQPFREYPRVGASDWYLMLPQDPAFMQLAAARWRELRGGLLSEEALNQRITALAEPIAAAAERDSLRWPVRRVLSGGLGPLAPTWSGQVQAVRDWLSLRTAWLDGAFE